MSAMRYMVLSSRLVRTSALPALQAKSKLSLQLARRSMATATPATAYAVKTSGFVDQNAACQTDRGFAPQGLVATKDLGVDDLVLHWDQGLTDTKDHWSLQIGEGKHLPLVNGHELRYINHSCDPNVKMVDGLRFVACRPIREGDELTIDYNCFEETVDHGLFKCLCGAPRCVGTIKGWKHLSAEEKQERSERAGAWLLLKWPAEGAAHKLGFRAQTEAGSQVHA
eukprot:TRINITY_DN75094_c0_g1_i1.p1 TRINITY_DN75094_c0_g1~~TRINITY_DN75094_c0_g1_i1.p1  ORF type:complete len:225 (+),score=41.78 TRINITY_DN75094_c0_g1_i1:85-759(+)